MSLRVLTRDRQGRTVAELIRSGRNQNLRMVQRGQVFADRQTLSQGDVAAHLGAERAAQKHRLGVWSAAKLVPTSSSTIQGRSSWSPGLDSWSCRH